MTLIGPRLQFIVLIARATYRAADLCVLLREGAWNDTPGTRNGRLQNRTSRSTGPLSSAEALRFFSGLEDPLSNVSAVTGLSATVEDTGASSRYHAQDGPDPWEEIISCTLLARMACVPYFSKSGAQDFELKVISKVS